MVKQTLHWAKSKKNLASSGDTIIEVVISIALLSTALAAAYASTGHSLQIGTDAGNRTRAEGYIQQQVEQIKYADQEDSGLLASYQVSPGTPFCIDPSGGYIVANDHGFCTICANSSNVVVGFADSSGSCGSNHPTYSIATVYDDSTKVFTSTAKFAASNGSGEGQTVVYYKLPDTALTVPPPNVLQVRNMTVESDSNFPDGPQLDIYANGTLIYSHRFASSGAACNNPAPGDFMTNSPTQFTSDNDAIDSTCTPVPLNLDLSSVSGTVTQIRFVMSNDRNGINRLDPPGNNFEDNNIILQSVGIPGKTVTVANTYTDCGCGGMSNPGYPPDVPAGSTVGPYSIWLLNEGQSVTFNVRP